MNRHKAVGQGHLETRIALGRRGLWTLALAVLACLCALATTAIMVAGKRDAIRGSGAVVAEDRAIGHVERVSLSDLGTLIITQGDGEALAVETDGNLMRYIASRVQGGTLLLGLSRRAKARGVVPSQGITYRLVVRHLAGLEVADAGRIQAHILDGDRLEIRAHDSGTVAVDSLTARTLQVYVEDSGYVHLAGRVERADVTAEDSGRYLAGRLRSRTAAVAASDSAEATLWATEALDATVTDAGHVRYFGEPTGAQYLGDHGKLTGLGEP